MKFLLIKRPIFAKNFFDYKPPVKLSGPTSWWGFLGDFSQQDGQNQAPRFEKVPMTLEMAPS
jgi:hypothetical protein